MRTSMLKPKLVMAFAIGGGLYLGVAAHAGAQSAAAGQVTAPTPLSFVTGACSSVGLVADAIARETIPTSRAEMGFAGSHSAIPGRISDADGNASLSFETNLGQSHDAVKFLARGPGYTLFLTPAEAVVVLRESAARGRAAGAKDSEARDSRSKDITASVVRMQLLGANPSPEIVGLAQLPGRVHYFRGNDSTKWRTNIPLYAKVKYRAVYAGVDLVYYGHHRQVEYDFVIAPGGNPAAIKLGVQGADKVEVTPRGDLVLYTSTGELRLHKPLVYQELGGVKHVIPSQYVFLPPVTEADRTEGMHRVGVQIAAHDTSHPLIIDPVLSYSTYLGGSGDERASAIAVDATGAIYVTGETFSPNFPIQNPLQPLLGRTDAFVTKLTPDGTMLVYSTFLGGSGDERGLGIAVDVAGGAYVTGDTTSDDFPTVNAFQPVRRGPSNAFVTKLAPDGSALLYSTYLGGSAYPELGGSGLNMGRAIAVDATGGAYVTGETRSRSRRANDPPEIFAFPTTADAVQRTFGGGASDAFVAKIDPALVGPASLVYSTYLGGNSDDSGFGIAVDATGVIYVTGETRSTGVRPFPTTPDAFRTTLTGFFDAFVTKIDPARPPNQQLVYSTYLGGNITNPDDPRELRFNAGRGIAVDGAGAAYATGYTSSPEFPLKNPFQATLAGCSDAFVTKIDPARIGADSLVYSTYLGGSGSDRGFGIAVDAAGAAYVTGETSSPNFPTMNPLQPLGGGTDAFVTKLTPDGSTLVYSTFLGGSRDDRGFGIAVDAAGAAYIAGRTRSDDFVTVNPLQPALGGGADAFVTKISP